MATHRSSNVENNLITLLEISHLKQANEHHQETAQLRTTIADLLTRLENHFDVINDNNILEQLVIQLREANQHLVIASMNAQTLQEAAELAKVKQEQFLAMLAHELRNPLAPIVMATELIAKLTGSDDQLPKLHGILARQVGQLSHLVDDLLDASRISSGRISLYKQEFTLKSIIDNAIEISSPSVLLRHQHLLCEFPTIPLTVHADFLRLSQVFSNLLINASKFSPEYESIYIRFRKHHEKIFVTIKDHGIGIDQSMQEQVFELFSQGYQSVDRAQGGLGIGLSLVRSIVGLHDGDVTVRSDGIGLGSEFVVELPLSTSPEQHMPKTHASSIATQSFHILVIEGNPDTLTMLAQVFGNEGHRVRTALNGELALQHLRDAKTDPFDLVICDLGLPNHDGFEIARNIRVMTSQPVRELPLCLIAYTGYNQLEDRARAKEAGFDHFLVKPVATDVLLNLISAWMST